MSTSVGEDEDEDGLATGAWLKLEVGPHSAQSSPVYCPLSSQKRAG